MDCQTWTSSRPLSVRARHLDDHAAQGPLPLTRVPAEATRLLGQFPFFSWAAVTDGLGLSEPRESQASARVNRPEHRCAQPAPALLGVLVPAEESYLEASRQLSLFERQASLALDSLAERSL